MEQTVFTRKDGIKAYLKDGVFTVEGADLLFSAYKTFAAEFNGQGMNS